jgi:hypothetical protein
MFEKRVLRKFSGRFPAFKYASPPELAAFETPIAINISLLGVRPILTKGLNADSPHASQRSTACCAVQEEIAAAGTKNESMAAIPALVSGSSKSVVLRGLNHDCRIYEHYKSEFAAGWH